MRRIKRRSAEKTIAVIIDGKDEKWYLETIKEHYPNMAMKKATIKPDLPQKKSVEELFALAEQKLAMESTQVILILDMDSIIKDHQEFERFRVYYEKYQKSTQDTLTPREKSQIRMDEKPGAHREHALPGVLVFASFQQYPRILPGFQHHGGHTEEATRPGRI